MNSKDGVALERISWSKPTQEKQNWHSAAQDAGFGTPGYLNSQYVTDPPAVDNFAVTPDIFSPDMDGYQDVLEITYTLDQPGYAATMHIYDGSGRLIKKLVQNEVLGTQGSFYWDGIGDSGDQSRIGVYFVYIELFDISGGKQHFKKVFTLAGKI